MPPASEVPLAEPAPAPVPAMTVQLFWTRLPDEPRRIDIPGYRDAPGDTKPLVVYGGVTNNGPTAIAGPYVRAVWTTSSGQAAAAVEADVVQPGTTTRVASLAPGASGDVIIVVTDGDLARRLAPLVPGLDGRSRPS